ncbi:MAG: DUF4358 domain-containing protein [Oscillospiraceae bacterium]|nr:DUF4358 domain-containing protein [Oscillospiraceae bacterium]
MKHMISLLLVLLLIFSLSACSSAAEEAEDSPSSAQTEETEQGSKAVENMAKPNPQGALEEIYAQLDRSTGLVDATDAELRDVMGFDLETIEEYYVRYMETDYGASDVYIIKPKEGEENSVREALKDWQESRIRAFSGYDIYNSTAISENAVIFQRGDYLVMLMLEDNDGARSIIEAHIPEKLDLND